MRHQFKTRAEQQQIKAQKNPMYAAHAALDAAEFNETVIQLRSLAELRTSLQKDVHANAEVLDKQSVEIANLLKG